MEKLAAAKPDWEFPNSTLTRIAFGSCHKTKYARSDLWPLIFQEQNDPQIWLWLGDAIYPPVRGIASPKVLEDEYRLMKSPNNLSIGYGPQLLYWKQQQEREPLILGSWDDHDYGANDYGVHLPDKHQRAKAFYDFLGLPPPQSWNGINNNFNSNILDEREGIYMSFTFGTRPQKVKIILLDTRWHRDDHCVPSLAASSWLPLAAGWSCLTRWLSAGLFPSWCSHQQEQKTVLGSEQWAWLEQQLLLSPVSNSSTGGGGGNNNPQEEHLADVTLVVSSIQVLSTNPAMEGWGHFPQERRRLIRLLTQAASRTRLFVLSGDVHHAEILDPWANGFPKSTAGEETKVLRQPLSFLEITSSGLTHTCTKGLFGRLLCLNLLTWFHKHRSNKTAYFVKRNFGRISLDWQQRIINITIHDAASGQVVLTTGPTPILPTRNNENDDDQVVPKSSQEMEEFLNHIPECMDGHLVPLALAGWVLILTLTRNLFHARREQ